MSSLPPDIPAAVSDPPSPDGEPPRLADAPETSNASKLSRTVRAFGLLAAANLAGSVLGFAALAFVARRAGPSGLGAYNFDLALAAYAGLVANLGISYLATRDIATEPASAPRALRETVLIQGALSIVLYVALVLTAPLIVNDPQERALVPVVALIVPVTTLILDWALLALRRSPVVAVWRVAGQVVYAALIFAFLGHSHAVLKYSWFNVVGLIVTMGGILFALRRVIIARVDRITPGDLVRRARRSLPFGYTLIMLQVYASIAVPLLGFLVSTEVVGIYSAALRLPAALIGIANVWLNVFFPHGSASFASDRRRFLQDIGHTLTATIVLAGAVATAGPLCARDLMPALFGPKFAAAAGPFALLSVASALILVQATTSNSLLASGRERSYARIITVVAVGLLACDLAVIPLWGAMGAAAVSVLAESSIVALTVIGVQRGVGPFPVDWRRVSRGALAITIMAAATAAARTSRLALVEIAVATVTFCAAAIALKAFDPALVRRRP